MPNGEMPIFFVNEPDPEFRPYWTQTLIWKIIVFLFFLTGGLAVFALLYMGILFTLENLALDMGITLTVSRFQPWLTLILAVANAWYVSRHAIVVPEPYRLVTLLFASRRKVRKSGWRLLMPLFENKITYVDMRSKPLDIPDTEGLSVDNVPMLANINIRFGVHPQHILRAVFEIDDFVQAVRRSGEGVIRGMVEDYDLGILRQRDTRTRMQSDLLSSLNADAEKIGALILDAKISDIVINDKRIQEAVTQVIEATQLAQAKTILAGAEQQTMKLLAASLREALPEDTPPEVLAGALMNLRQQQTISQLGSQGSGILPLLNIKGVEGNIFQQGGKKRLNNGTQNLETDN